jgi:hypothetical protein
MVGLVGFAIFMEAIDGALYFELLAAVHRYGQIDSSQRQRVSRKRETVQ